MSDARVGASPDLARLLRHVRDALGDGEAVERARVASWRGAGTFFQVDGTRTPFTAEWAVQLPHRNRIAAKLVDQGGIHTVVSVLNEHRGWEAVNGTVTALAQDHLAERHAQLHANWGVGLAGLADPRATLTLLGTMGVGADRVAGIQTAIPGLPALRVFVKVHTGRIAKIEARLTERGMSFVQESFFMSYVAYEGVYRPTRLMVRRDSHMFSLVELSDFAAGNAPDALFLEPP